MAKLGNLFISLFADTAQFSTGLNKAKSDLNSSAAAMNRGLASIEKGFKSLASSILPVLGIAGIAAMTKQALDAVGGLGELADQLGITTDTLQAFSYGATQAGLSQEELETGIAKLTKTIGLAATGNKAAIDSFNQFGIKILDAQGNVRSTDAVIRDIAEAISKIDDPAKRAALATELLGKAGQKLIPFLQDGSRGIDTLVQKAKDLGLVLDRETIDRADKASDTIATLSTVLTKNFQGAIVQLAPYLTDFANTLITITGKIDEILKSSARLPLETSLRQLQAAQEAYAGDAAEFAKDPDNAYNIYGITQESLRAAAADIADRIQKIRAYADRYGLQDTPGLPQIQGGKHGAVAKAVLDTGGASNPLPTPTGKSEAEKNIEKLQSKLRELQDQLASLDETAQGTTLSKALAGLDADAEGANALVVQISALAEAIDRAKLADEAFAAQQEADAEAVKIWSAEMERGKEVAKSVKTPIEEYRDSIAELNQLHMQGAIDTATWARATEQAKKTLASADENAKKFSNTMTDLGATWSSAFEDAALAMDDAGFSAESLGDVLKGLLQDIERIILRMSISGPIAEGIGGINWGSLFGTGLNDAGFRLTGAGPGASGNTSAGGGFFSWLGSLFGFHGGGIAGGTPTFTRRMPMAAFAGAARLHGGGFIGPGEVPAILRRGEGVFTAEQMASLGPAGGAPTVNIINQTGVAAQGTAESKTGPNGDRMLEIVLKKVEDNVRSRGNVGRAIEQTFGASRVGQVQRN